MVSTVVSGEPRNASSTSGEIRVPLDWFPRLIEASPRERRRYQLIGGGRLIHWPDVDEDIDVPNLLRM